MTPTVQRKKTTLTGSNGSSASGLKQRGKKQTAANPPSSLMYLHQSSRTVFKVEIALIGSSAAVPANRMPFVSGDRDKRYTEQKTEP